MRDHTGGVCEGIPASLVVTGNKRVRARARNYGFILVLCLAGIMFFLRLVLRRYIRV